MEKYVLIKCAVEDCPKNAVIVSCLHHLKEIDCQAEGCSNSSSLGSFYCGAHRLGVFENSQSDFEMKKITKSLFEDAKRLIGEKTGQYFKIELSINSKPKSEVLKDFDNEYVARKMGQALLAHLVKWMLMENNKLFEFFENCDGGKGGGSLCPQKNFIYITFKGESEKKNSLQPSLKVLYDKFEDDAKEACEKIRNLIGNVKAPDKTVFFTYGITTQEDVEDRTNNYPKPFLKKDKFIKETEDTSKVLEYEIHTYNSSFQDMRIHELLVIDMIKTNIDYSELRPYLNNQNGGGALNGTNPNDLNKPGKSYVMFSYKRMNCDGTELPEIPSGSKIQKLN